MRHTAVLGLTLAFTWAGMNRPAHAQCVPFQPIGLDLGPPLTGLRVGTSLDVDGDQGVLGSVDGVYLLNAGGADGWLASPLLRPPQSAPDALFGVSVGLTAQTLVVGASHDDSGGDNAGAIYTLDLSGQTPPGFRRALSDAPMPGAWFGRAVAIDANTIAVGSPRDDRGAPRAGSVIVLENHQTGWSVAHSLLAPSPGADDGFGMSVAISGERIAVGVPGDDRDGSNAGAVHLFVRAGDQWVVEASLVPGDAASGDAFGQSVDLEGDRLIVGAWGADDPFPNAGAAYVFERAAGIWQERAKLTSAAGEAGDMLGASVAISGAWAVVGSVRADGSLPDTGAAILFRRSGAVWHEVTSIHGGDAGASAGAAVALSGDTLLIGAPFDDTRNDDAGLVVSYDLGSPLCPGDFDLDCAVGADDVEAFLASFGAGSIWADRAAPVGVLDFADVTAFLLSFTLGCP
ncbi:MAG: hypothetical protein ACIARR_03175 [Phycisphaerales bacterium JB059]